MNIKTRHSCYLIFITVLIVYLPSIFAEINTVDDFLMLNWIKGYQFDGLYEIFFPKHKGAGYYRPIILLSQLFDKYVLMFDTRMMHLVNIFVHGISAVLVYLILASLSGTKERMFPVLFSLLFALHPIATESVCWLSGRTDLFCGLFILVSTFLLFKFSSNGRLFTIVLSVAFIILAYLAKEVALGYLLGWLLLIFANENRENSLNTSPRALVGIATIVGIVSSMLLVFTYNLITAGLVIVFYIVWLSILERRLINRLYLLMVAVVLGAIILYLTRKTVFTSSSGQISSLITLIVADSNYVLQTFFGALAFYIKKFFDPFPLNFAIREVSPIYNIVGLAATPFILLLLIRKTIASTLFIAGICLILPALPLSLGSMAWTAYAERYVYIASAFFCLSLGIWTINHERYSRIIHSVLICILMIFSVATVHRCWIWRSNLLLFEDTINKSPNFRIIRNNYMIALMEVGKFKEAEEQYLMAQKLPAVQYLSDLDLNYANLLTQTGRYAEADRIYGKVLEKSGETMAYLIFLRSMHGSTTGNDKVLWGNRLLEISERSIKTTKNNAIYYEMGKIALGMGNKKIALDYFTKGCSRIDPSDERSKYSCQLVTSLNKFRED